MVYFKRVFGYDFCVVLSDRDIKKALKDKRIVINSVVVDSFFSKKERAAFRYFLSQKKEIISREQIAKAVWGNCDSYSDWALDQFIRRLRKKYKKEARDRKINEVKRKIKDKESRFKKDITRLFNNTKEKINKVFKLKFY